MKFTAASSIKFSKQCYMCNFRYVEKGEREKGWRKKWEPLNQGCRDRERDSHMVFKEQHNMQIGKCIFYRFVFTQTERGKYKKK